MENLTEAQKLALAHFTLIKEKLEKMLDTATGMTVLVEFMPAWLPNQVNSKLFDQLAELREIVYHAEF